jgi:hypothetical protein
MQHGNGGKRDSSTQAPVASAPIEGLPMLQVPRELSPEVSERRLRTARLSLVVSICSLLVAITALSITIYLSFFRRAEVPKLSMLLDTTNIEDIADGKRVTFGVGVENGSPKAASQFYWVLLVPEDNVASVALQSGGVDIPARKVQAVDGSKWLRYDGQFTSQVNRGVVIFGALTLEVKRPAVLRWQMQCCDTLVFPDGPISEKLGMLPVDTALVRKGQTIKSTLTR